MTAGGQRSVLQAQLPFARTEAPAAAVSVVIGPFQFQIAQRAPRAFPAAASVVRLGAAGTGEMRAGSRTRPDSASAPRSFQPGTAPAGEPPFPVLPDPDLGRLGGQQSLRFNIWSRPETGGQSRYFRSWSGVNPSAETRKPGGYHSLARTREKMSAARKKGKWIGGHPASGTTSTRVPALSW